MYIIYKLLSITPYDMHNYISTRSKSAAVPHTEVSPFGNPSTCTQKAAAIIL